MPVTILEGSTFCICDDFGDLVGTFLPKQKELPPEPLVPWDPSITMEEIERRMAGPFLTLDEYRKRSEQR